VLVPLIINVGLSRKASENYQSTGMSINISAELDQSLLARSDQLQQEIDRLYGLASDALDRQEAQLQTGADKTVPPGAKANDAHGGNGSSNGSVNGQAVAPMTQAQNRAIVAITQRLGIDACGECRSAFGWDLAKLSIRQASEFIDHLKGLQPAGNESP
jgi:hypothetical protein